MVWALGEKHPTLIESKSFFFGLINVPLWNYYYGLSSAMITLMASDCPIINYNTGKNKKKKSRKPKFGEVNEAKARWESKYGNGTESITVDINGYK